MRSDVEAKAVTVWGSLENINKEKEKRKIEYEKKRQDAFILKKSLRDYQNRIDQLENPYAENRYSNTTIFKTLSGKVVLVAVGINAANFLVKFIGWMYSGSSSLFSEAVHSLADTINQLILAFGLHQSLKRPNKEHPYGYSNMTYITSLISGVGIFCIGRILCSAKEKIFQMWFQKSKLKILCCLQYLLGTGISVYHGIMCLYDPQPITSLSWVNTQLLCK